MIMRQDLTPVLSDVRPRRKRGLIFLWELGALWGTGEGIRGRRQRGRGEQRGREQRKGILYSPFCSEGTPVLDPA